MSELLYNLRLKKKELELDMSVLTLEITNHNVIHSNKMKEILLSKFERIQGVIINNDSITFQVRSDDGVYAHDVNVTNRNSSYDGTFVYNPKIQWSSGSITRSSITYMNYINVVAFVASEITKPDDEFSSLMESAWSVLFGKNNELYNIKDQIENINRDIENEIDRINKIDFFNNLKDGNYYYNMKISYNRISYEIIKINKINSKTVSITMFYSITDSNYALDNIDGSIKRIQLNKIYDVLRNYILFEIKDFDEIIMDNKFNYAVNYVYKNRGIDAVENIKSLCALLYDYSFTNTVLPDNNTLHYISKWRYKILKYENN